MIYESRGYPSHLIIAWIKKFAERQWETRHDPSKEQGAVSGVLKSVFNPVWEHIDIKVVQETINAEWRLAKEDPLNTNAPPAPVTGKRKAQAGPSRGLSTGLRPAHLKKLKTNSSLAISRLVAQTVSDDSSDEGSDLPRDVSLPVEPAVAKVSSLKDSIEAMISGRMLVSRKRSHTLGNILSSFRSDLLGTKSSLEYLNSRIISSSLEKWRRL